jgi:hypothetical protein
MSVAGWNWDVVSSKAKELTEKYGLGRKKTQKNEE